MRLSTSFPAWLFDDVQRSHPGFGDLDEVVAEFPGPDDVRWQVFEGPHEPTKRQGGPRCWGPATTELILTLLSSEYCQAVGSLIDCPLLIGDVYGGGMHLSGPGARLDTHVDFNTHPRTGWRRRVNLLLYLNHHWHPDWGGQLELDRGKVVLTPEFGRLVIFETGEDSWHGHPKPIVGEHWRRSIAVYYYDASESPATSHSTIWAGEVGE